MKEKLVQFLRYVNKFGLTLAVKLFYKTRLSRSRIVNFYFKDKKVVLRPSTSDVYAFDLIFLWDEYKLSNLPFEPKLIIDCGANIGLSAIYFCSKYPHAAVFCIEPAKENIALLKCNVSDYPNGTILPNALMSSAEEVYLNEPDGGAFDSFKVLNSKTNKGYKVKSVTIDDVLAIAKNDTIDILKIDIEGSEKEVFSANFSGWLPKTKIIIIELHDRIQSGCSKAFFKAIINYDFDVEIRNESLIAVNRNL